MNGTIVCGVGDAPQRSDAAELAGALGARLGLRLVLVHVVDGVPAGTQESLSARQRSGGAARNLDSIARSVGDGTETRVVFGEPAASLAQIAAEEGADLIVLGARAGGLRGRKLRSALAFELEAATPVPVLVAPPSTRKRSNRRLAFADAVAR
jgi:nucleotide-binding universal stress UspA family protein